MSAWAWRPIQRTSEWVRVAFVGDREKQPIGATVYLRLHDGAIVLVGSACYFYGLFDSDEDVVAAFAGFDSDADPELIEDHIHKVLLEAHLDAEEAVGRIERLDKSSRSD